MVFGMISFKQKNTKTIALIRQGSVVWCMGVNLRQGVSDSVYSDFVDGKRDELILQDNDYYARKLKGIKYLWLVNEELPEKPEIRYRIEDIIKGHGGAQEDIYGQFLTGSYLSIKLKKRQKT